MNDFLDRVNKMSPKRLALLAVELHEQLEASTRRLHAPIAVIGMGCRFPGPADSPEAYWELLSEGRDAIREVPPDRWDVDAWFDADPDAPGRMSVRTGGFLEGVDQFDPAFFGIAPREALTMDPQQRLLLEVAWEALEHAGIAPSRLFGTPTGVFVGVCNGDHFQRVIDRGVDRIDTYMASGNAHSVTAGRISYVLGLQGPAVAVDTACSSSLVALHLACQSVRIGESQVALAAGVNLMCSPETTVALSKGHMLAPDGRCKAFDARADGFARAEGCGVLVLKLLDDAVRDGDRVLAVVRGTASNQDGRSGGLTVPNGPAQEAVVRAALADASLAPADVDYVEAHGTGTSLGDPIEVRALAGALGPGRDPSRPLLIGSVKTNLGHLESAAGVAGVMKVILSLQHERIPAHLHFETPSPHIAWSEYPVEVTARGKPWPRSARRRVAGVSSFGFSGTNAHVVIEEAPLPPPRDATLERPMHCLPLSAKSEAALRALAGRFERLLDSDDIGSFADIAHTAAVGRSPLTHRAAVVASSAAEARAALAALADGGTHDSLRQGTAPPGATPDIVFMFTGAGAQYPGMGRALYESSPVFRAVIDQCDALLGADAGGRTLLHVLREGAGPAAPIHEIGWTQPAMFAIEVALATLWRSWGIEPAAVIGHSVGEYAAACVAGVFSLEDGVRLIAERGRLMEALPPGGGMAAFYAPAEEVAAAVAPFGDRLAIAAYNAPDSVVVSGASDAIDEILATFAARNVQGQRLYVSLAAHSPLMDPALDGMEAAARGVALHPPRVPVAWNLTGGPLPKKGAPDAVYWRRHMREPVRFGDGIASLYRDGYRHFLEVGPHPTLLALAQRSLPESDTHFASSLRRGMDDWREIMTGLADLFVTGAVIDWAGVDRPYGFRRVSLPTYPFQRSRFWIDSQGGRARGMRVARNKNPLEGARVAAPHGVFETELSADSPGWLSEHRVHGAALVAAPVFFEMIHAAARDGLGGGDYGIADFMLSEPLTLTETPRVVQVHLAETVEGQTAFSVHSRAQDDPFRWTRHASGTLVPRSPAEEPHARLDDLRARLSRTEPADAHYAHLTTLGIELGPSFRAIAGAQLGPGEALATVSLPESRADDPRVWNHPALIDGALQTIGLAVPRTDSDDTYVLAAIDGLSVDAQLPSTIWCHASSQRDTKGLRADLTLYSSAGRVGTISGVSLRRMSRDALAQWTPAREAEQGLFYEVAWEKAESTTPAASALATPTQLAASTRERFDALAEEHGLDVYGTLLPELDGIAVSHISTAFAQLGFDPTLGRRFDVASEARTLRIVASQIRLFERLLGILVEEGALQRHGTEYVVAESPRVSDATERYAALAARLGKEPPEASTLRRCGAELDHVLRGERDPLQLLFPNGSFAEARGLYVDSPYARTYNGALRDALEAASERVPAGSRLRVLEVGAGTGGTTSFVLPVLPADRTEYTFTDVSPMFLDRAREQFGTFPFVRYTTLDIERDPRTQGFAAGAYDIVIAANVLHATVDLGAALANVRELLAPSGLLFVLEGVAPERWVDLSFGMTEGWWRFRDTRADYPLVSREAWRSLIASAGFTQMVCVPDGTSLGRAASQQALFLVRAPEAQRRDWTLVADGEGVAEAVAERLRRRGDSVAVVRDAPPEDSAAIGTHVVYFGALDLFTRSDDPDALGDARSCAFTIPLAWLARVSTRDAGRVWMITRGAEAPQYNDGAMAPEWQSLTWGLGRVFALEHPSHWGGLVDLDPALETDELADAVIAELDATDGEDQVARRGGQRFVARLRAAVEPSAAAATIHPESSYLVTGGFGGLGAIVARWLVERGARTIVLTGRHPNPAAPEVQRLEALGATVACVAADVADATAMTELFARFGRDLPPLRGIVHAAAAFSSAPIKSLTVAQVDDMFRPKLDGTILLERLSRVHELDFLVLFSSTTSLLGAAGLGHYAAANAFLDAAARSSRARGTPATSINWGTWKTMRLASQDQQRDYQRSGLEPMSEQEALGALGRVIGSGATRAVVARADWTTLKELHQSRRARPFLEHVGATRAATSVVPQPTPRLADRLANAPFAARNDVVMDFVREEVAAVLGLDAKAALAPDTGLFEMGMDSLMSVELRRRLAEGSGRALPSTLTFNYPSIAALTGFLESELARGQALTAVNGPPVTTAPMTTASLDTLSDSELEARLRARLDGLR
ncbi:MAG: type I polyketide synthase [Gemmatimonadales bacterium]